MKTLTLLLALAALSGAASASQVVFNNFPANPATGNYRPIGDRDDDGIDPTTDPQFLAEEDFTLSGNSSVLLSSLSFYGGAKGTVGSTNDVTFYFDFYASDDVTPVGSFTYTQPPIPTGTTFKTISGLDGLNIMLPTTGFLDVSYTNTDEESFVQISGLNIPVSVGSSDPGVGSFSDQYGRGYNMALQIVGTPQAVPEPSAFAALGLGAFGFLRRRKRA